jgi:hypothetical protein
VVLFGVAESNGEVVNVSIAGDGGGGGGGGGGGCNYVAADNNKLHNLEIVTKRVAP